ncbi:glycosyltransferase family 4 protein [Pediococcus ethanolidurans]|uniref:glycosyltransferase family 4 protein n=1 Tax=Pediococcus ethanolidurans TaxID=319653 RepID=UPI0021E8FFB8|nr:glycosyltransferase family 4 protein [Pediococcus ethanolidurans]MCV3327710.1 glycosyltransferase family 4 protein [Pediococcus ethanolidurans]
MLYVAEWDKEFKKTWSGTTYGLLKAGQKQEEIRELHLSHPNKILRAMFAFKTCIINGNFETNMNFNINYQNFSSKKVNDILTKNYDSETRILQIGDIASVKGSGIYQDLSVGYLANLFSKDPTAFKFSGFQRYSETELKNRMLVQNQRYGSARYIFTMSKFLREFLIKESGFPAEKVIHVGGGLNSISIEKNTEISKVKNRRRILFVGRDFYRKGGDLVVEAFSILKANYYYDAELYIVGPDHIEEKFKRKGVHFLGELSTKKTAFYFNLCDVFCMPSRFEAYGLVFPEALASGLPCIGRSKFEMPNFIDEGKTGYLLKKDDPQKLALMMASLLANDEIFENVKNNKALYIEKYSWNSVFKRIMKAYEKS